MRAILSELIKYAHLLRVHQWLKNMLLFFPLLAAHVFNQPQRWLNTGLAFIAWSLCASSVYILNDWRDLANDRAHPRKALRPLAAETIPLWVGTVFIPVLLLLSFTLAWVIQRDFFISLWVYFGLTCLYSFYFKQIVLIDTLMLACLYTLRIIAGTQVGEVKLSFWMLAFSIFLFLSLAFVKRYAELTAHHSLFSSKIKGRGYYPTDAPLIQSLGIGAGYAAVIVFALYLNSSAVTMLYPHTVRIWGAMPLLLFWINWVWMQAHRGRMHDDPLVFAIKDKASLATGLLFLGVLCAGALA